MTLDARQAVLLRPAAVAVHDDGDVLRQRCAGFGTQVGCGGTHFVCQQITRIALISKIKKIFALQRSVSGRT
jgi:hypothetical protein